MPLKLGTAPYTYLWDLSLDDSLRRLADMGVKTVELMATTPHLWPGDVSPERREEIRALAAELGLEIVALNPTFLDLNIVSTNPGFREESIRQLQETISLCSDLGAEIIVVSVGQRHPLLSPGTEWLWRMTKEGIERCLETCAERRVHFGLENAWSNINRAHQMVQMVEEVDSPWLGIVYDIPNAAMVQSPYDGLYVVADHLIHVHISDTTYDTWGHNPVGHGVIDFSRVAEILRTLEFAKTTILEVTWPTDPDNAIRSSLDMLERFGWKR